ncbi:MAG: EamA family transporter [Bacteroidetes bacterium]|nr:EamA family transporter [Bacteroidota bacterium]
MIELIFSVISSTLIYVAFKSFSRFSINTLNALIVNYFTAFILGFSIQSTSIKLTEIHQFEWFWPAASLGVLFILIFYLMVMTTQKHGMSVVSVASKMSLSIPVIFVIFYYGESLSILKVLGIILALVSVYLVSAKTKDGLKVNKSALLLPFAVFIGSGIIESSIKVLQNDFVPSIETPVFSASIFLFAALTGSLVFGVRFIKHKTLFRVKDIIGGIALGVPNYFSIYFIIQALRNPNLDSSIVFVINNVSIVVLSTIVGILLFKEHLLRKNKIGIGLALLSIILVALANYNLN